jgi:phosphoglycolate phosphatase-like HAD superfamily hydrolase
MARKYLQVTLFDYDGVLADTLNDMLRFAGETCAEMGFPRTPTAADLDSLESMSFIDYGRQLGVPAERAHEFARRTMARFEGKRKAPAMFEGMDEVVRVAASRGQVGIVTASTTRAVLRFLEAHRLQGHIDALIAVEHPGSRVDKILAALGQLDRQPQEATFVGDAVSDIRASRQVGLRSVAVTWGHQSPTRLSAAGPDHLVRSPRELLELLRTPQPSTPRHR